MAPSAKTTYLLRILILLLSGAALAGCIWMQVIFHNYRNVITKWKYRSEYALAAITVAAYILSFVYQRLGRLRSKAASDTNITLGCILGALWLHTCLRILIPRERQVLPVDYPYTDRDNIGRWSRFDTRGDHNLFDCTGDPNSRLGEILSHALCNVDQVTAIAGAVCGLLVIVESCMSYSYEKQLRRQNEQQPYGDYALGYNPVHTTVAPPPPTTIVVETTPVGYAVHTVAPAPAPAPFVSPYNAYETVPAYDSRSELAHLDDGKDKHGKP